MPHKCVHCSTIHEDGSEAVLNGCSCGSRFFFYISKEKLERLKESQKDKSSPELSSEEKKQIEEDVREIIGLKEEDDTPVVLDFESIKVLKPGKYLIDIHKLFGNERPLIYHLEEGKYIVDLASNIKKGN